ncbi:transposase [Spirosoma spitsbergense]|uniref:transposase n=1 Tax=Spirosoma spitsbergense TaxID=431554 RepID=UPI00036A2B43|nr:transposase [Spirosoma spitsbergense]
MEQKSKRGAPTKYKPEYAEEARKFCLLEGATDEELATSFGVSAKTIDNWKIKYPDFLRSVQEGKKIADANVAEGFYKRAVGIEFTEVTRELIANELTVTKEVTKLIPPDPGAALNWLKNRQPAKWRDKVEVAHSGKIETNDLSHLSDEQLNLLLSELQTKVNRDTNQP